MKFSGTNIVLGNMASQGLTTPHVVIVGGGFAGLETAKRLRRSPVRVTLIDRHNYHLFQPLLYQVATGGLSPANIATPLRSILRKQRNCETLMAEVVDFDVDNRRVTLADGELEYDHLVVATGATHSYFGRDDWAGLAPGLKTVDDATYIRRRILMAFEMAERERDEEVRARWMTFVIVGAGPTGVELAGAISEIALHTLRSDFRHINPGDARILLVEAAPRILAHYPDDLSTAATSMARGMHIEVHSHCKVTHIQADQVTIANPDGSTTVVPTCTVLWAAGVQANPLGKKLADACGVAVDRAGRVPVDRLLRVGERENVSVIGDLAVCLAEDNKPLPGLAAVAVQQGEYVAKRISAQIGGRPLPQPFRYRDRGTMATVGRAAAVADIKGRHFTGYFAWMLWLFVHLLLIVQFQNRALILIQWAWNYLTFSRSARLITGEVRWKPTGDRGLDATTISKEETL